MNPSGTASSMSQPHAMCAGVELCAWNVTRLYRHGFAFVRKDWNQRRRAEIVME